MILDQQTFKIYLNQEGYTSENLLWYLNYCCRDEYGQGLDHISAYAGLHYFASRRGKGSNCDDNSVLVWPEGNGYLVKRLSDNLKSHIKTGQVARQISYDSNQCTTIVTDAIKGETYSIKSEKVILCVPQFARKKLLPLNEELPEVAHQPWLVANITFTDFYDKNGFPMCWDNVFKNSETLGFVYAQHQSLKTIPQHPVFTLYKPLDKQDPTSSRKNYYSKTDEELQSEILNDITAIYPDIAPQILTIDCHLWGHGMASPGINYIFHPSRHKWTIPIADKIYFAHSDYSGISIFEEAFYQGQTAAKKIFESK